MNINNQLFKQEYKIRSININTNKKLGLYGLLGLIQDAATEHAHDLNFGYETMKSQGFFWVLVRQKLKMKTWPKWHDYITIKTWTIPSEGFYAIREFEFFIENEKIGECSTTWMILDSESRKPKDISETKNSFLPRTDYSVNFTANKIALPNELEPQKTIEVKISDLDMNNHVNNIKYSQWILDTIPFEYHKKHTISEFEINFLNESFLGDQITIFSNITKIKNSDIFFSGNNTKTLKPAFFARLKTHE